MERIARGIYRISASELESWIEKKLRDEEIEMAIRAIQIHVDQPFGAGMTVHNETPSLTIMLTDPGL